MLIEEEIAEVLRGKDCSKEERIVENPRKGRERESTYQIVNLGNVGRTEDVWKNGQSVVGVISTEEGYQ